MCFNPCFPGSSAESRIVSDCGRVARAVSILVFLDQALKASISAMSRSTWSCFNPCFPGSSAESGKRLQATPLAKAVSILVFLDQALKGEEYTL